MAIRVFQVDPHEIFQPYSYEREAIRAAGGELVLFDSQTEDDVIEHGRGAEILLLTWKSLLTPRVMDALADCRLIVRWGVGYDVIDVRAATERGIAVANAPSYCTEDVAEHAVALLVGAARRLAWFHGRMQAGGWPPAQSNPIHRMRGRTLGIVGLGRIGSAVAWRARGLGLRVIGHDRYRSDEELRAQQVEPRSLGDLLAEADYVSVHVPLNAETRSLIDAAALAKMKPGAFLVNTSRGPVVNEPALVEALAAGRLAGAALDVFEEEPLAADSPLRGLDHVILTPHMAAYSVESWDALRQEMCATVAEWIRAGWARTVVNPEVRAHLRPRRSVGV